MQLVLELLKKIFAALQGVYTKQESDAALATKADVTALTEEATAREQADAEVEARIGIRLAEHDAEIDTLQKVTAGLGEGATAAANVAKWQTYATAIQKDLDATTAMQFAQEFSRATDEYLADPTATRILSRTNNPYESTEGTIVDFSVVETTGSLSESTFVAGKARKNIMFFGSLMRADFTFMKPTTGEQAEGYSGIFISPNLERSNRGFMGTSIKTWHSPMDKFKTSAFMFYMSSIAEWTTPLPVINDGYGMFQQCPLKSFEVDVSSMTIGSYMFKNCSNLVKFSSPLSSLKKGIDMFINTNLDKESVLTILNSLPDRTGVSDCIIALNSNVLTAAINNIDAEIQAAIDSAVAKNWTVITA